MICKEITVTYDVGLDRDAVTAFIRSANEFQSQIHISVEGRRVNAKSLLGVLSLGIAKGMSITLIADGQDEEAALDGLSKLIDSGFDNN